MGHRIWERDEYSLRKYAPGDIDYFLDIGMCVGVTSMLFKALVPGAVVVGIEPCLEDYEEVHALFHRWRFRCYHLALGNGEPLYFQFRHIGSHRCYTPAEIERWEPKNIIYTVESKTFPELCKQFKIKGRYIIKVDCEGGERFLLGDEQAFEIIKGAVQFNIEIHKSLGGTIEQWAEWFDLFEDTHTLYTNMPKEFDSNNQRIYRKIDAPKNYYNRGTYMLVKK